MEYRTKVIKFFGKNRRIFLQNDNGPCPLLAISNALSLKNDLNCIVDVVSHEALLGQVVDRILEWNASSSKNDQGYNDNQERNIADAMELIPRLATGIDVNLKFRRIDDFEFTPECALFDLLGIRLYHGWIPNPWDRKVADAIGSKSYNVVMQELVALQTQGSRDGVGENGMSSGNRDGEEENGMSSGNRHSEEENGMSSGNRDGEEKNGMWSGNRDGEEENDMSSGNRDGEEEKGVSSTGELVIIRDFLEQTASQLTAYGLACLQEEIEEGEICVFFRNNHFNTMFKHRGELYVLATDQGYQDHADLVWERLDGVNGDTTFMTGKFKEFKYVEVKDDSSDSTRAGDESNMNYEPFGMDNATDGSSDIWRDIPYLKLAGDELNMNYEPRGMDNATAGSSDQWWRKTSYLKRGGDKPNVSFNAAPAGSSDRSQESSDVGSNLQLAAAIQNLKKYDQPLQLRPQTQQRSVRRQTRFDLRPAATTPGEWLAQYGPRRRRIRRLFDKDE